MYKRQVIICCEYERGIFGFDDREKTRKAEIRNDKNSESELTLFVVVLHLYKKKDNRVMI